jgi:hypothetical protein
MTTETWLSAGAVISGLFAAGLWVRAASIFIPDNLDTFMIHIQRAGR